jgi:glutaredoxin
MNKYYLYAIILKDCPYSEAAVKLLTNNNNIELKIITQDNKDKYKTNLIQTFPQIYLKKQNHKGSLLIGGYSDISEIYSKFKNKYLKEDLNNYISDKSISKRAMLRIIELINNIN